MKKTLTILAATAAMLVGTSAPAAAAWKPTLVPLTAQVQSEAYNNQLFDCYYYESGIGLRQNERVWTAFYRARCNPNDQLARSLSRTSKQALVAYHQGLRTGWCHRWLGRSPIGTPVSTTCIATVRTITERGNVRA